MVHLSQTKKMPCKSWSLPAVKTCPGAHQVGGGLVDACKACYARTWHYSTDVVMRPRLMNMDDWQRLDWVDDMVSALDSERYFRWFDSGDIYHVALAEKILLVMESTPWCKHWLPTRSYKFPKLKSILETMMALPNVMVRFSSDSIRGEFLPGLHGSVIYHEVPPEDTFPCHATIEHSNCGSCRACWDKAVPTIAYKAHGGAAQFMLKGTKA